MKPFNRGFPILFNPAIQENIATNLSTKRNLNHFSKWNLLILKKANQVSQSIPYIWTIKLLHFHKEFNNSTN